MDLWLIPVCTGNIEMNALSNTDAPVYPCAYREHYAWWRSIAPLNGLSLCIQGTSLLPAYEETIRRFIPVHTGNIIYNLQAMKNETVYPCVYREHYSTSPPERIFAVYPCVYREHTLIIWKKTVARGLSLCIQGTYSLGRLDNSLNRFIPVYTGNMWCCPSGQWLTRGLSLCIQGTCHYAL